MRPRTLRELTDLAREEMSPSEEERDRVYSSLCAAVAAGAAGAALGTAATAAASSAGSSAAAGTSAAATSAAASAATSTAVQGGALATGVAQAGVATGVSSGLLLKGFVLVVALGGGAGLLSTRQAPEVPVAEHAQAGASQARVPLREAASARIEAPAELALEPGPESPSRVEEVQSERSGSAIERRSQRAETQRAETQRDPYPAARSPSVVEGEADITLTQDARRLQRAQRAMARGDGAATLELLAAEVDSRLQAERLALRVLAFCQLGDARSASRDAVELRGLDDDSSAALARIADSCVGP